MKMTSNKITNTKVGDDIHFYVNGSEDRGIVVKMNNEYVTVFKESTQEYDDIHINDTFFIKDILVNKEWDKMEDNERYEALVKIHAPSPRYMMKSWDNLPKEIKELLTKNNAIETSHKEGKDDDMNNTHRTFDKGLGGTERKIGEGSTTGGDTGEGKDALGTGAETKGEDATQHAGKKVQGKKHKKERIETNPETKPDKHGHGKRGETKEEEKGHTRVTGRVEGVGTAFTTSGGAAQAELDRQTEESLGSAAQQQQLLHDANQTRAQIQSKQTERKERKQQSGDIPKKVTDAMGKLKAWQLWLAKREQEVLKDSVTGKQSKEGKPETYRTAETTHDLRTTDPKSRASDFQWHKSDVANRSDSKVLRTDEPERTAGGKVKPNKNDSKWDQEHGTAVGTHESDSERVGRADTAANRPSDKYNTDRKVKAWEQWLTEQKSNTERSIHGNAGRNPNAGVNTNTGFDAPKDYEGFSHSGIRPEQFKHERKKPKVTNKERVNIGSTAPPPASQGTGDGGNPYNTKTQNKDKKGRAEGMRDRN